MKAMTVAIILALMLPGTSLGDEVGEWGRAYLSFSPDERDEDRKVVPFEPFTFYLVMEFDSLDGPIELGVAGCSIIYAPSLVLTRVEWGENFSFDIGHGLSPGNYDFIVAWYPGVPLGPGPNVIGRFTGFLLEETDDVLIEIRKNVDCPWSDCDPLQWVAFDGDVVYRAVVGSDHHVMLNRSSVTAEASTWSRVKALYHEK